MCVRHCSDLRRAKDPSVLSVSYLHLYQYHILTIALRYFMDDLQGGVTRGRSGERNSTIGGRYAPTLSSSEHFPGTI